MEKKNSISLIEQIKRNEELPPQEYIWRSITPGSLGFVFGPPKSGKTTFCENLAMSIAFSLSAFFGYEIESNAQRKVLFISMEEYWRSRVTRNAKQISVINDIQDYAQNYVVPDEVFPRVFINNRELKEHLQEIIDETKPNVLFIDSMTRIATKDIEDSSTSGAISLLLRELANANNVAIVVIHHTHKLNGNGITIDSLAGSRVLAQEADWMIGINKTLSGQRYFKEVATRYGQEKEDVILFDIDQNQWLRPIEEMTENDVLELKDRRRKPDKYAPILNELKMAYTTNITYTQSELIDKLKGTLEKSSVYNYIKDLERLGKVKTDGQIIHWVQQ